MKKIAIIGSTGSIGESTLKVARHLKDSIQVVALAAGSNSEKLEKQVEEFQPKTVALYDEKKALEKGWLPGMEGVLAVATAADADIVVSAMTGTLGLLPTISAIEAGKDVALANKEALVSGGALVMNAVKKSGVNLIPVDSEHSAIFQCMNGERACDVRRVILTSSGGPFRNKTADELATVTIDQALNHPTWSMGPKVTIDSSTLMNKGLEVIEARWLFDLPIDQIDVVIHPQSIIHSMVEFRDGSIMAQMGEPTMTTPIQYALTYPERLGGLLEPFDFTRFGRLDFFKPDRQRFRCLDLAFQSIKEGGSLPCFMNAANEVLVHRFLAKEIAWTDIGCRLDKLMQAHNNQKINSLDTVFEIDVEARRLAQIV